jgi:hypothetical protein
MYFVAAGSQLVVLDTLTRARTVVSLRLPSPSIDDCFAISPDGRTISYGGVRSEADIWIAERNRAQSTRATFRPWRAASTTWRMVSTTSSGLSSAI